MSFMFQTFFAFVSLRDLKKFPIGIESHKLNVIRVFLTRNPPRMPVPINIIKSNAIFITTFVLSLSWALCDEIYCNLWAIFGVCRKISLNNFSGPFALHFQVLNFMIKWAIENFDKLKWQKFIRSNKARHKKIIIKSVF